MMNLVRIYNVSAELTGEGVPLEVDWNGTTYTFLPSDCYWEKEKVVDILKDPANHVQHELVTFVWTKNEEKEPVNYTDVPAPMSSWLFNKGMTTVHKNILKTGTEMEDVVMKQIEEKQRKLEAIEKEVEIAEKKAASKKRGPGRPAKAIAEA